MRQDGKRETILVVEDDVGLARGLVRNLVYEGYEVELVQDGDRALERVLAMRPDVMILDLMLPGLSGLDVLEALRDEGLSTQVIILSALGRERDRIRGLRLGADDYVAKPFSLEELLARVGAGMRRSRMMDGSVHGTSRSVVFGDVVVDMDRRVVTQSGRTLHVTPREFDLLVELVKRPGRVLTREDLLRRVWGFDYEGTARTVDNFVRNLRRKVEPDPAHPRYLLTVHGMGYRFEQNDDSAATDGTTATDDRVR